MNTNTATNIFESLSSAIRLDVYRLLVKKGKEGMVAGEIATTLDIPPTNLSFHLKALTQAGLATVEQEGRFQRYRANLALMLDLIAYLTEECCEGHPEQCSGTIPFTDGLPMIFSKTHRIASGSNRQFKEDILDNKTYNVLFICTGNSARSIMAEVIMNHLGNGRFNAYSAGSHPRGEVHPLTGEILTKQGYDVDNLRSKSWIEFAEPDAPKMDFIFTVCDQAGGEVCPTWPGKPITAHWGFPDPTKAEGDHLAQLRMFVDVLAQIANRIQLFMSLPIEKIDQISLQNKLRELV